MSTNPEPSKPRQAVDFDEILDDLAGIDPREPLELSTDEDGSDAPLSTETIDGAVATVAKLIAAGHTASRHPWWLKPAAVIPFVLVLLSAIPAYFLWDPRNSDTLSYEDAHIAAFDYRHTANARNVAVGKIAWSILRGITAIRWAATRDPKLAADAKIVLDAIESMSDNAAMAKGGKRLRSGTFQKIVDDIRAETSTEAQRKLFARFLNGCMSGFQVIHRGRNEPGLVGEGARGRSSHFKHWCRQPLTEVEPLTTPTTRK